MRSAAISTLAAVLVLGSASPALAGDGTIRAHLVDLTYESTPGGATGDVLTVDAVDGGYRLREAAGALSSPDCQVTEGGAVATCPERRYLHLYTSELADLVDASAVGDGPWTVNVRAGAGDDVVTTSSRNDLLDGGAGADRLTGGAGADSLTGGPGQDTLTGGDGDDGVLAQDGEADLVDCGAGADQVTADPVDTLLGCEQVSGLARLRPTVLVQVQVRDRTRAGVLVGKLRVRHVVRPTEVTVTCTGGGCPFERRRAEIRRGRADLTALFAGRRVRGVTLEVTTTRPGTIGAVDRIRITRHGRLERTRLCAVPRLTTATACA